LNIVESESEDLTFYASVLEANTTIPVIVTYQNGEICTYRNLESETPDSAALALELNKMKENRQPITLVNRKFGDTIVSTLYNDGEIWTYRSLESQKPNSAALVLELNKMKENREPIKLASRQFGETIVYYL